MAGTAPVGYNSLNDRQPRQSNGSRSGNHEQVAHDGEGRPQRPRHADPVVTQFTTSQINYGYDPCANCSPVSNFGDSLSPSTSAESTAAVDSVNSDSRSLPSFSFGQDQGHISPICPRLTSNIGQQHLPLANRCHLLNSSARNERQSSNASFGSTGRVGCLANAPGHIPHQQIDHPARNSTLMDGTQHPAQSRPKTIECFPDTTTMITGGPDGCLIVSDVATGHIYDKVDAHTGSVTAVDAWYGHVVSTGVDRVLNVYSLSLRPDYTLKLVVSEQLPSVPGDIKLVEFDEHLCVGVIGHTVTYCDYYSFEGSLSIYKSVCLRNPALDPFICQEMTLNARRTHYAVIGKRRTHDAEIIAGRVGRDVVSDIIVTHQGQFRYLLTWEISKIAVWFIGNSVSNRCIWASSRYTIPENRSFKGCIDSLDLCRVDDDELADLTN